MLRNGVTPSFTGFKFFSRIDRDQWSLKYWTRKEITADILVLESKVIFHLSIIHFGSASNSLSSPASYLSFLQNLTMQLLSAAKACFLSESTENMPEPEVLIKLLDQVFNWARFIFN